MESFSIPGSVDPVFLFLLIADKMAKWVLDSSAIRVQVASGLFQASLTVQLACHWQSISRIGSSVTLFGT